LTFKRDAPTSRPIHVSMTPLCPEIMACLEYSNIEQRILELEAQLANQAEQQPTQFSFLPRGVDVAGGSDGSTTQLYLI
jgi:hypothetical protein